MADGGQSAKALVPAAGAAKVSALERIQTLGRGVQGRWVAMPPGRRTGLAASALVVAAICAGMIWYAGRPDWRLLFSGLDSKDAQQITQELTAAGIAYQLTGDGSGVEVSAEEVDKARMEVAAKGMPQSGRMGFELFDKPNWVGSEFDEKVNYQRALEGELEHTIGTLAVVRAARVHLVLPKDSLFGEGEQAAKASVVLQLRRSLLPQEQAEAIRSLVAGAVENLNPGDVTLVDADGRLNLAAPTQGAAAGDAERALADKLVAMLEPTVGSGNVHATVNVIYDQGSEEKTDEVYDPALSAPLSTHKTEQTSMGRAQASGVPGTASNTPGAAAPGSVQAGAAAAAKATTAAPVPPLMQTAAQATAGLPVYPQNGAQGGGETMTEETNSFAVTRHMLHTEQGPGRIRRLTAAVVVNDRVSSEGVGKLAHTVWKPRSAEEMQRLEQLTRAAVGFDGSRGDQVVIENVGFSSNVAEATPAGLEKVVDQTESVLHDQPALLKAVTLAGVCLMLALLVLKPMTQQMVKTLTVEPSALVAGDEQAGVPGERPAARSIPRPKPQSGLPSLASLVAAKRTTDVQEIYEHISDQIRREPAQSTRLLESWINAPAEEEE